MKRIIKNNYQPNKIRIICPICNSMFEFDPKFDLNPERIAVDLNGKIYTGRQISCPCCTRAFWIEDTYPYHVMEF